MMFLAVKHVKSSFHLLNLQPYDCVYNAFVVIGTYYLILGDQITIFTTGKMAGLASSGSD
jgi:hypothetical protein